MPLSKDEHGGGTEKGGAKSQKYCSHCYIDGSFTLPNITAYEMKDLVEGKLREVGIPKFLGRFFTRNIHNLERWRK